MYVSSSCYDDDDNDDGDDDDDGDGDDFLSLTIVG